MALAGFLHPRRLRHVPLLTARRGFDLRSPSDTAALLLTPLAEEGFAATLVESGCAMRAGIDEALDAAPFDVAGMRDLVADMTYDYLHA